MAIATAASADTARADLDLRSAFDLESRQKTRRDTQVAAIAVAIMFPLFSFLDAAMYPELARQFLLIRLGVVAVSLSLIVLLRTRIGERWPRLLGMIEYIVGAGSIAAMLHVADGYASPYYAGIILVLIGFLFILPLSVVRTAIICAIVYLSYLVPILIFGQISNVAIMANNNFFLLATMILVVLSSYLATEMRRKEFTSRFQLAHANDELRKLDVLKSQFFANISHEIRTPLTSIMAPIQSLYHGDVGSLTSAQRDLVGQVYRNSIRLLDLVNQMLDFAKFDARKMQLRLKRVHLEAMIRDHVTLFQEVCLRKGLSLGYQVTGAVPVVYLDEDKTERILSNLIRNAIKFTERGSVIVELSGRPDTVTLRVRDTGIGIAKHQLSRIFERFQQVDGSSTRKYEGTGLGLTIVKEAAELMHGTIRAESVEGLGTTITVSLPTNLEEREPDSMIDRRQEDRRQQEDDYPGPDRRSSPRRKEDVTGIALEDIVFLEAATLDQSRAEATVEQRIAGQRPATGLTVLYVEDSSDLRHYVRRMLTSFGHAVITAVDGLEGWERVKDSNPDIVVSDVMMPRLDGFELLRRIKTDDRTNHTPVVLITAKSEVDSKIAGLEIGADDYLSKPIDVRELDARIRNIVTTKRFQEALTTARELEARIEELSMSFSRSLALRDRYTAGHSNDVLEYGTLISEGLGIKATPELREALLLHDIGKIGIPDSILQKTDSLTEEEWEVMRRHPEMGRDLLGQFDSFKSVARIICAHHEHFDGSGYPDGLSGEQIPLEARIIAVADAWHAMREDRPYRKALTAEIAVKELRQNRGKQFDPKVVDAFLDGLSKKGAISGDWLARMN